MEPKPQILSIIKSKPFLIGILIMVVATCFILVTLFLYTFLKGNDLQADKKDPLEQGKVKIELNNKSTENIPEDLIFKVDNSDIPMWIEDDPQKSNKGPWFSSLYISSSEDGLDFNNEKLFLEHSGVANLILDSNNRLIATFQYFSFQNESMFDVIAYATSDDFGQTWSEINKIEFEGLPEGSNVVDPTLVELDDSSFRLYFTFHQNGDEYPQLFSARSNTLEGSFVNEGKQLATDEIVLDPAVIKYNGIWHHYTVKHGNTFESEPNAEPLSIHSVSDNGLNFTRVEDIDEDMSFLGGVIEVEGGLRFYNGNMSAFSIDGYTWNIDSGERVKGADPGVVKLPDGTYLIIYTSVSTR